MEKELKQEVSAWIEAHQEEFKELSERIWKYPELGMEEYQASAWCAELLKRYGFEVKMGVAGMPTAFVARWGTGAPVVGISVEYDSLGGLSQKAMSPVPEAVVPGAPGHGCGHSIIGVAALLNAVALKEVLEKHGIEATLKVFGTPAEEICVGKPFMARAGCFDGLDYVLDWHPWYENRVYADFCSAYFNVKYHFHGKNAHGSAPWNGRSTLDAALWTSYAIDAIRIRPEAENYANTINYTFSKVGPSIANVVPDGTDLWCIGRFRTSKEMQSVMERIDKCASAGALATGTTVEREFITASREKIPNCELAKVLYKNMQELGVPEYSESEQELIREMQTNSGFEPLGLPKEMEPFMECGLTVTDSAEYSWKAPTANFAYALAPEGGWHNWRVASCAGGSIGMKCMVQAAKLLAVSNIELIFSPDIRKRAREELDRRLEGQEYRQLIPDEINPPLKINAEAMQKYRK